MINVIESLFSALLMIMLELVEQMLQLPCTMCVCYISVRRGVFWFFFQVMLDL